VRYPSETVTDSRASLFRLATLLAVAVLLADVASKNWALSTLGSGHVDLGLVGLTLVQNDGLAFSTGAGLLSAPIVLALRVAALLGVLGLAWRFGAERPRYAVGFALVLGGGFGNAGDVLLRGGAVVDFIHASPLAPVLGDGLLGSGIVLNLADVWILTGLACLYPLFRAFGLAVQRRLERLERHLVLRPGSDPASRG
jgi:lipoprotein signal peptidase